MATKINVNVDLETKEQATKLLKELGLDMTTAINIFLKRLILEQGIPFEVSLKIPNAETLEAILEAEDIRNNPSKAKTYKSVAELRKNLGV